MRNGDFHSSIFCPGGNIGAFFKGDSLKSYTNSQIIYLIDEYVHSARNRAILKRRLIDGICFEPLAEEFELSVRQVKNIVYKEEQHIFPKLP